MATIKIQLTQEEADDKLIEGLDQSKEFETKAFIILSLKPQKDVEDPDAFEVVHFNLALPDLLRALWLGAPEKYKQELVDPYLPDGEKHRRENQPEIKPQRVKPEIPIKR